MGLDPIEAHFGPGPVTATLLAWTRGEIGADVARDRLVQPQVLDTIDLDEFARLSDRTVRWAYRGHWQQALALHEWLAQVLMAAPDRLGPYLPGFMMEHLRVVTVALCHQPDARRYRRAVALAEGLLGQAGLSPRARAKLAHELGVLHLDPWVANRQSRQEVEQWVRAATTPAESGGAVMPGGAEAMDRAEHWLRESLQAAQGVDRLESLKALLQCLFGRELFGGTVDPADVRALLDEATALLPQAPHRDDIAAYLQMVAQRLGTGAPAPAAAVPAEDEDWEARAAEVGIEIVGSRVFAALAAAERGDRDAGLRLARRVAPLIDAHASESSRLSFHQQVVQLLAGPPATALPEPAQAMAALRELAGLDPASPSARSIVAQVLSWVMGFVGQDREADARALINTLAQAAPRLWDDWGTALNLLAANLDVGAAVNAVNGQRVDEAVQQYHSAWSIFRALQFDERVVVMLGRIADLLPRASVRVAQIVCELVREQPGPQASAAIEPWQRACTQLAAAATRALEAGGGSADAWYAAARLAKGPTYGALVARPRAYDWQADRDATDLLDAIRALEAEVDAAAVQATRLEYGDLFEQVLVAYRSAGRETAGATAAERRDNLVRRLDLHVRARLAALDESRLARFTLDEVAARLPADAVLLDVFLPRGGAAMGYCLGVTSAEQRLFGVRGDDSGIRGVVLGGTTAEHEMTPSAFLVAELRQHLQDDPPPGVPATAEVLAMLAEQGRRFLGHAFEWLQQQHAAGKRHLIVVPSGPLHFYPVHLLGLEGRTLADDWTVTYLPSLDLLRGDRPPGAARTGAAVFALGYEGPGAPALEPLRGAVEEGRTVARALGVTPTPEADATPSRLRQALAQAAVVHVACHGEHDVVAPALQCLRLMPEPGSDGRLSALDLLALDLRGLSVLGLSACETALGRFDLGDNLQGLAANALARGAEAVVGTLWPCADDASAVFFGALYRQLARGASRRDAFRAAQVEARREFGEHRDWAAFYLSGLW